MKRSHSRARVGALGLMLAAGTARAGEIEPPLGPIAPTMVTLDSIEPRNILKTYFGSADAVHLITAPGQYLATEDIYVPAGKSGIVVQLAPGLSGPVTIDLNGFSIVGQGGSVDGVQCLSLQPMGGGLVVHGGRITGMGGDGVSASSVESVSIAGVEISDCGHAAARVTGAQFASLIDSYFHRTEDGIVSSAVITLSLGGVTITECTNDGVRATGASSLVCAASTEYHPATKKYVDASRAGPPRVTDCGGDGLELSACASVELSGFEVARCAGNGVINVMTGDGAILRCRGVTMKDCGQVGLGTLEPPGCSSVVTLESCAFSGNGSHGVHLQHASGGSGGGAGGTIRLTDSIFEGNMGDGCRVRRDRSKSVDMRVDECAMNRNGGDGLKSFFETGDVPTQSDFADVIDSSFSSNSGDGLEMEHASLSVSGSSMSGNGGTGASVISCGTKWEKIDNSENASDGLRMTGGSLLVLGGSLSRNGTSPAGGDGLHIDAASTVDVRDTTMEDNSACGMRTRINELEAKLQAIGLLACTVSGNSGGGVIVDSTTGTSSSNAVLRQCTIVGNGGGGGGGGTTGGDGLLLEGCLSVTIEDCTLSKNAGRGGNVGVNETLPDTTLHVSRTSCDSNGSDGLSVSGYRAWTLSGLRDSRNAGWGIYVGATCVNGEMEGCRASGNFGGIRVDSLGNTIVRNSCTAGPLGALLVVMPGNAVGPVVDEATIGGTCNPHANIVH